MGKYIRKKVIFENPTQDDTGQRLLSVSCYMVIHPTNDVVRQNLDTGDEKWGNMVVTLMEEKMDGKRENDYANPNIKKTTYLAAAVMRSGASPAAGVQLAAVDFESDAWADGRRDNELRSVFGGGNIRCIASDMQQCIGCLRVSGWCYL